MKKKLKVIALICVLILGISIINNTVNVYAETTGEKTNFKILTNENEKIIYTYDENGKSYRVEENINPETSKVDSIVYVVSGNGKQIPVSTIETTLENDSITIKTTEKNETITETFNLDTLIQTNVNKSNIVTPFANEIGAGSGATNWQYSGTIKSSTNIAKYTVGAVRVAIQTIAAAKSATLMQTTAIAVCGYIAGVIVESRIPTVYYTKEYYSSFYVGTTRMAGEKVLSSFYSDSARKNKIDTAIDFYWN